MTVKETFIRKGDLLGKPRFHTMAIVEEVISLQEQGYTDEEIVAYLQERGLSPNEIEQALNQSKIKIAVSNQGEDEYTYQSDQAQQGDEQQYPEQSQQYYQPQQEYPPAETISEIVDQLLAEKLKKINESISTLIDFKISIETKMTDINSRLKKVEDQIDNIKDSVIGKIGSYGRQIETVNKEVEAMQESFGKMVNPMIDRARTSQMHHSYHKKAGKSKIKQKQKSGRSSSSKKKIIGTGM